jgi:predicted signal transduction protein with EAL and GGDEF domain
MHPNALASTADLRLYRWLSRFKILNYGAKILVMAFIGIHVPLMALAAWYALQASPNWDALVEALAVTLAATLVGTAVTLWVLHQLLRPVAMTSRSLRAFCSTRERIALPTGFADEVGTLMADADQTLDHLAHTLDHLQYVDEVTGLPNRKRLAQSVDARIAQGQPVGVAVLRFSNLGRIVETLDIPLVHEAVRTMARRLGQRLELADELARVGPSRFACLVHADFSDADPWAHASVQLRDAMQACGAEFHVGDFAIAPVLHAGLAVHPDDGIDGEALIDSAIAAATLANAAAPVVLHGIQARRAALDEFRLEQDLRRAIDREEFALHFQPVVDVLLGRTVGAEALLRWTHPERGRVPPLAFIGVAETSGLIDALGLWVLRTACAQVRTWNDGGLPGLRIAVNVSARQFLDPALKRHVMEAVDHYGIAPNQLEIELTETAAMVDHEHTRRVLSALRDAGVGTAIDDFGTGYASLSYLRKLPFDKLKIDREFVTDVHRQRHSQAICGALIELSKGLDLQIVAEGAESEKDVRHLADRGCRLFQGYYFSQPVAAADFAMAATAPGAFAPLGADRPAPAPTILLH